MSDIAVWAEGLGKEYHIGSVRRQYNRLGDQVVDSFVSPFRRARKLLRGQATGAAELDEIIWALKDISIEIKHGEVVGIIGRNGAGKSTLLKILSRITEPTEGYADIYGRVGSLLEVGTGFHPELTGRENIYLNGAILGMKKAEIERKFDEIVAFAEIGKFIDTPVKHYSSGMYVRLAFSIAAHLEPEILLVDEVLAVGDVAFQKKCLGKMDDVAKQGRTVLFVSHNMGLMQTLCQRGIFLQDGIMSADGPIGDVVDAYLRTLEKLESQELSEREDRRGQGAVRLVAVQISDGSDNAVSTLKTGGPACFTFHICGSVPGMACIFSLYDHLGQAVVSFNSQERGAEDSYAGGDERKFVCELDELLLLPGRYRMDVSILGDKRLQDSVQAVAIFDVAEGDVRGRPAQLKKKFRVCMPHRWTLPED
ncbi:MAG: ABC transporter ATP-binding protein [Ardenticatenaceae bacterium]|nr:ABC transporter ATP-binding protein [Ardenticatenaceae bacterium]